MRDIESSMAHVPRRAANVLTGPTHPAPNFMPFTDEFDCENADVLRTTNAAIIDMRSMDGTSCAGLP
jgi:hypothetical protein